MSIRDTFFTNLTGAAMWDVAVAIKRGNALPLDRDSVFQSYEELTSYINNPKGSIAYPGQVVAVVNANSTDIYYLDQELAIKPVGIIPTGDNKSIEVTAEGMISLLGAEAAPNGTLPMIGGEGKLEWKTLEEIGAGDGNDNTTYEITALEKGEEGKEETYGIQIQVKENGIASGDPIVIDFDVYTKSEADTLLQALETRVGERIDALTDTTYSVKEGEKILKLEGTEFSTVASLKYVEATETTSAKIQLLGIDEAIVSEIDATPFIKDGMLHDVDYDPETNKLIFTWNTDEGEKTDEVILSDIIEPYTAGAGLELSGNEFKVKIAEGSDSYLTADENGLKLSGVSAAITSALTEASSDAQAKADQALADAKADAANLYATKNYVGTIPETYTETNVISYINKKAEETLAAAQGGSSETAASVKLQLDNYKSENDTKVNANATAIETINEKLNTIDADADVNVIEKVKVNGTALTIDAEKAVDITVPTALTELTGWSTLDERVTAAKNQADGAATAANAAQAAADTNAGEIVKHASRLTLVEGHIGDAEGGLLKDVTDLKAHDTEHSAQFTTLSETVTGHGTTLANWTTSKANTSDLNAAVSRIAANETNIQTIKETTIPGVLAEVNKKANAADVYTKTEIGAIAEGKTIVSMIAEAQTAATYDDTAIKGLLTEEVNRATAAEGALSGRLDTVETFFAAVEAPDETINTLSEIVSYIESDKSGAAEMAGNIKANADAILAINNETTGILAQAKDYTNSVITALPNSGPVAGALLGLVKSSDEDNKIKVETDGTMSVNRISTDKLYVAEGSELVLNGGSAV